jgi:hypothetical protein
MRSAGFGANSLCNFSIDTPATVAYDKRVEPQLKEDDHVGSRHRR